MYIVSNALKNLRRNKGRNILMAIIIFVIIVTTAISITINTTTSAIIDNYKSRFGAEVNIEFDESHPVQIEDLETVSVEERLEFAKSDFLKESNFSIRLYVVPEDLKSLDEKKGSNNIGGVVGSGDYQEYREPTAVLIGTTRENISTDFEENTRKIIDGRIYENKNECLVSEDYAKLNSLKVGDQITIGSMYTDDLKKDKLTISGIYEDKTEKIDLPYSSPMYNRGNEILVSFEDGIKLELASDTIEMGFIDSEYILKDPKTIKDFEKELRNKGLSNQYLVSTDDSTYNKIVGPVEGLQDIIMSFLIVVLILGSIILIIVSVQAIRERKYEIGVLRAMGMKKINVAIGLLTESIVITSICLCLGLGIGAISSKPIADTMLKSQIEIAANNQTTQTGSMKVDELTKNVKPLEEINVEMNKDAILQISLISLVLAGISSIVGISYITKFEPMQILRERN